MRPAAYSTVVAQGSPAYEAPCEPSCPPARRFMAVHRISGGGWGIVDRRSGRLLAEARPDQHRYATWDAATRTVRALNAGA